MQLAALFRYKLGVTPVIGPCGGAGLLFNVIKPWLIRGGVRS